MTKLDVLETGAAMLTGLGLVAGIAAILYVSYNGGICDSEKMRITSDMAATKTMLKSAESFKQLEVV